MLEYTVLKTNMESILRKKTLQVASNMLQKVINKNNENSDGGSQFPPSKGLCLHSRRIASKLLNQSQPDLAAFTCVVLLFVSDAEDGLHAAVRFADAVAAAHVSAERKQQSNVSIRRGMEARERPGQKVTFNRKETKRNEVTSRLLPGYAA